MTADKVINWPPVEGVLARSIKIVDIPPRPAIMDRIRAAINKDVPNFKYVGQLISADVSLAAGLVKTANSPYFGFRSRARTINEALLMLGLDATCRAVAALCFRSCFPIAPGTNVLGCLGAYCRTFWLACRPRGKTQNSS